MSKETFSLRLRAAMARKGKKQVDLIRAASEQGVKLGKSHMSQYVSGKTLPRPDIMHFLADVLQVDEQWLQGNDFTGSDSFQQPESHTNHQSLIMYCMM